MSIPPEALTRKALLALEEICGSPDGRFPQSMALRFVLAYLYAVSKTKNRHPFDELWKGNGFRHQHSKEMDRICRSQQVNSCINGIYNAVGVHRSRDFMFYKIRQEERRRENRDRL